MRGWGSAAACGVLRPGPAGLVAVLLPIAPLLIPQAPGPGCSLARSAGPACPSDRLVAFLGRQPYLPATPGLGGA